MDKYNYEPNLKPVRKGYIPKDRPFFKPKEVAVILNLCRMTVYRAIRDGRIVAVKPLGGTYRIHRDVIKLLLKNTLVARGEGEKGDCRDDGVMEPPARGD